MEISEKVIDWIFQSVTFRRVMLTLLLMMGFYFATPDSIQAAIKGVNTPFSGEWNQLIIYFPLSFFIADFLNWLISQSRERWLKSQKNKAKRDLENRINDVIANLSEEEMNLASYFVVLNFQPLELDITQRRVYLLEQKGIIQVLHSLYQRTGDIDCLRYEVVSQYQIPLKYAYLAAVHAEPQSNT